MSRVTKRLLGDRFYFICIEEPNDQRWWCYSTLGQAKARFTREKTYVKKRGGSPLDLQPFYFEFRTESLRIVQINEKGEPVE